jgi:hypothetical protein
MARRRLKIGKAPVAIAPAPKKTEEDIKKTEEVKH